jgi:trans-AT polyketide synthase/acyltransferase/oxidoreductase domain-containing protein
MKAMGTQTPTYYISQPMLYKNNKNWYGFKKVGTKVVSKKSLRTASKQEALVWLNSMKAYQHALESPGTANGGLNVIGWLDPDSPVLSLEDPATGEILKQLNKPIIIVHTNEKFALVAAGPKELKFTLPSDTALPVIGCIPTILPRTLGDSSFCKDHGTRFAYYAGAMANAIASVEMVEAIANAGFLGFFGAAGLSIKEVEKAVVELNKRCQGKPFGMNLIHSPSEPALEGAGIDLYLKHGIHLIEAAAFMRLTLPLVRFRVTGIHRNENDEIITPNRIIAKISREEVAAMFMAPPPEDMLDELLAGGEITQEQAEMCLEIPMAQDITAEADSGGHTDNRPSFTLLPTIHTLRDEMQAQYGYTQQLRVGLGGGISTPASAAAAFAMGAAYIVTGTVNQACIESGTSDAVREMLATARQADIAMAPSADMFELGVHVQVLKRGTMFSMRAGKLYELYRKYNAIEEIPPADRQKIEKSIFQATLEESWEQTRKFWEKRNPEEIERARSDPKHKMSLIFRSYLGQASIWANQGLAARNLDYQIWCGPAIGAFNEWTAGSPLEKAPDRQVVAVAMNIMYGAALQLRCNNLRIQGLTVPPEISGLKPIDLQHIEEYIN